MQSLIFRGMSDLQTHRLGAEVVLITLSLSAFVRLRAGAEAMLFLTAALFPTIWRYSK